MRIVIEGEAALHIQADATKALRLALPQLWDRIVPQAAREESARIPADLKLVSKIVPGRREIVVLFNPRSVFQALKERHIAALVTPPRFHLLLRMESESGQAMPETQALLHEAAERIARKWGIDLSADGPGLVLDWRWLDDRHLRLRVRGNTRLGEFSATRVITGADPLPELTDWLREILLRARDAYAFRPQTGAVASGGGMEIRLTVVKSSRLLEQVALEEALTNDPRVRDLLPLFLNRNRRTYLLRLEGTDDAWLRDWFSRRGFHLSPLPEGGWLAR